MKKAAATKTTKSKSDGWVTCRECALSYGYYGKDVHGDPFMNHCKAKGEWGAKYYEILDTKRRCSCFEKR